MNKKEFVNKLAEIHKVSASNAEKIVTSFALAVADALKSGEKVELRELGVFSVADTKARVVKCNLTGGEVHKPAGKKVTFKPSKSLKDSVV